MHDIFKAIGEAIQDIHNKEFELAAIWLENPLQTATERTVRITEGHLVTVKDGELIDCNNDATHKVIGCMGTASNSSLSFILTDLKTNEPLTLKVK